MRVVIWVGNESNQRALVNKLHAAVEVVGIVTESRPGKRKITPGKIIEKIVEKLLLRSVSIAWLGMKQYYQERYPTWPEVPLLDTVSINTDDVFEFTRNLAPDLIVVSGTSLVRKKLLSINPSVGIVNLHTGLSPYIKGGPNCTNWCIATGQFHLIGNTVMWIDAGIDTGNIIATELTQFTGNETLTDVHIRVMEHAHDLYVRGIQQSLKTRKPGVNQDELATGKTYYSREWGLKEKLRLVRNLRSFRKEINSVTYRDKQSKVKLVDL